MVPKHDVTTQQIISNETGKTFAHTVSATKNDMGIVVKLVLHDGTAATDFSGEYDSVAMTKIIDVSYQNSATDWQQIVVWVLANPSTGSNDVAISWVGSNYGYIEVSSYSGVNQIAPYSGADSADGESNAASIDIVSAVGSLALDVLSTDAGTEISAAADQIERMDQEVPGTTPGRCGGSEMEGQATTSCDWAIDTSVEWLIGGFSLEGLGIEGGGVAITPVLMI